MINPFLAIKLLRLRPSTLTTTFIFRGFNTSRKLAMATSNTPIASLAKQSAAYAAVDAHFPKPITSSTTPTYIGIGSGSTVVHVVNRIAQLPRSTLQNYRFIPTGFQSRQLIVDANLTLSDLDSLPPTTKITVCFDGADECDSSLNLIKGGGACQLQEKLVALNAEKFIMVADRKKLSTTGLCNTNVWKTGIPIEVIPGSYKYVEGKMKELGATKVVLRGGGTAKAGPCVTDNGCFILDCLWETLSPEGDKVQELAEGIKRVTGVVEHGLFYAGSNGRVGRPVVAYLGDDDGKVEVLEEGKL